MHGGRFNLLKSGKFRKVLLNEKILEFILPSRIHSDRIVCIRFFRIITEFFGADLHKVTSIFTPHKYLEKQKMFLGIA